MTMYTRATIFNFVQFSVASFLCWYYNLHQLVWNMDITKVSILIAAIYFGLSLRIWRNSIVSTSDTKGLFEAAPAIDNKKIRYYANTLPLLGIVGSSLAATLLFYGAVDQQRLRESVVHGISSIFITTFAGVLGLYLSVIQLGWITKDYEENVG